MCLYKGVQPTTVFPLLSTTFLWLFVSIRMFKETTFIYCMFEFSVDMFHRRRQILRLEGPEVQGYFRGSTTIMMTLKIL